MVDFKEGCVLIDILAYRKHRTTEWCLIETKVDFKGGDFIQVPLYIYSSLVQSTPYTSIFIELGGKKTSQPIIEMSHLGKKNPPMNHLEEV